ncbi:tRNA-dihydrouridine(20) synthase [NAD(P)+]-like protein [Mactra antiquata]
MLEVLGIHVDSTIKIDPDAFSGLDNVNTLDFTGCSRLELDIIKKAVNGSEKVPKLEKLILSGLQVVWSGLEIDREFSRCLTGKPLKSLDLSKTRITFFYSEIMQDLNYLRVLNLSKVCVNHFTIPVPTYHIHHMDLDISYSFSNKIYNPFATNTFANLNVLIDEESKLRFLPLIFAPQTVNVSNLNDGPDIRLYNMKIQIELIAKTFTKEVISRQNKLKFFDVQIDCDNFDTTSVELIDFSGNGMEYFHPSWLTCLLSLGHLNLNDNNLNTMQTEHVEQFGLLLNSSKRLTYFNLAFNQLTDVPEDFFMGSKNLETILLAGNRLTQVRFNLHHLLFLRYIDLSNNYIRILDATSMKQLDTLIKDITPNAQIADTRKMMSDYSSGYRKVKIKGNPFECDSCNLRYSIHWLVSTSLTESTPSELTCKDESGTQINLNDAVNVIKDICERKKKIIVLTTTLV